MGERIPFEGRQDRRRQELIEYLFGLHRFGMRLGLERIEALLARLGEPQRRFASVHVAGTNGKGSTAAALASILRKAGLRTGLYTSPHLVRPEQRIAIDGAPIACEEFVELVARVRPLVEELGATFFEAITAMAFLYFAERQVDVAVVEVGLGGRLDATNVLRPLLSLITSIDLDHVEHLGATVRDIAQEKAGIIKPGVPCLTSAAHPEALGVLRTVAASRRAPFHTVSELFRVTDVELGQEVTTFSLVNEQVAFRGLRSPLVGEHQLSNCALAVSAAHYLSRQEPRITASAIRTGLEGMRWPGRLQKIAERPTTLVDVAHNPAAMRCIASALGLFAFRRLLVVMGVMRDKDYQAMVAAIAPVVSVAIAVAPATSRALPGPELAAAFRAHGVYTHEADSPWAGVALARRLANAEDLVLCTGSHYTVGEVLAAVEQGH
ncbi:MAG: folylpolyglutamate synthase/dihydrofolate synthase family protein [bacterium]|jgi:dihydrofolate synthase/folylpolyglutamate synthase|nr:bifunctional folylpolyglutamate synthase/dihydrofolate synthase [candidate division KSB1 bacterium]MDH7561441.1 folylpolyglutamate synthase/dihydrofolate synthase family protein [bacterium]